LFVALKFDRMLAPRVATVNIAAAPRVA
jgi:hypothetical protein